MNPLIHLTTMDRGVAVDFADQLCRKGGLDVAVYTSWRVEGYLVLDRVAFFEELLKSNDRLKLEYSPERRASPRVPFKAFVRGRVLKRVANA